MGCAQRPSPHSSRTHGTPWSHSSPHARFLPTLGVNEVVLFQCIMGGAGHVRTENRGSPCPSVSRLQLQTPGPGMSGCCAHGIRLGQPRQRPDWARAVCPLSPACPHKITPPCVPTHTSSYTDSSGLGSGHLQGLTCSYSPRHSVVRVRTPVGFHSAGRHVRHCLLVFSYVADISGPIW